MYKYNLVATGGTFDRFHKGHEALLNKAFAVGKRVIIGVTSDWMVKREPKILKKTVLPYEKRIADLKNYLKQKGFLGREIIEKLNNIYGPTVINGDVGAVICTRETRWGAVEINKNRAKHGKRKLAIIECPFITSADHQHISSTRIRLGQINREGEILIRESFGSKLPQSLRTSLRKPIDKLFVNVREALNKVKKPVILIAVGDVVNQELDQIHRKADIAIIDLKIGRKNRLLQGVPLQRAWRCFNYVVKNKTGTVSPSLIKVLKKAVKIFLTNKKKLVIRVIGEEDLAVIPAILIAPLESIILYGQPACISSAESNAGRPPVDSIKSGVVRVVVTEEKKKWAVELLQKFK